MPYCKICFFLFSFHALFFSVGLYGFACVPKLSPMLRCYHSCLYGRLCYQLPCHSHYRCVHGRLRRAGRPWRRWVAGSRRHPSLCGICMYCSRGWCWSQSLRIHSYCGCRHYHVSVVIDVVLVGTVALVDGSLGVFVVGVAVSTSLSLTLLLVLQFASPRFPRSFHLLFTRPDSL